MKIELHQYNDLWPLAFESEKAFLMQCVGSWLEGEIEHVGSTSIPGMLAKPIIDIMFGVESLEASKGAIEILRKNGYCYAPYKQDVMHWFCKPTPDHRTHHLHLVPYKSDLWFERINFRDILRASNTIALEYSNLKLRLAKENSVDRDSYTAKKWPFIERVLNAKNSS